MGFVRMFVWVGRAGSGDMVVRVMNLSAGLLWVVWLGGLLPLAVRTNGSLAMHCFATIGARASITSCEEHEDDPDRAEQDAGGEPGTSLPLLCSDRRSYHPANNPEKNYHRT